MEGTNLCYDKMFIKYRKVTKEWKRPDIILMYKHVRSHKKQWLKYPERNKILKD